MGKKLVLIAAAIGVLLLGIHLWSTPHQSLNTAAPPATATPTSGPHTLITQSAPATHVATARPNGSKTPRPAWEATVQGFALAYPDTDGHTRKQWLANLRPYLAHDVLAALSDTNLDHIPAGHYAGYQTLKTSDHPAAVRVSYQEGWALVLYLSATREGTWRVTSLDLTSEFDD